jgi:hypothetical protein
MKIRFKQDKKTILSILKTGTMKRKIKVIDSLNGVNEKDSIQILLKILEDTSWVMRERAALKIVRYGTRVVPRLQKLCKRGYWYTRAAASHALGEIGHIKALDSIIRLITDDENPTVVKEASAALVKIAKKKPIEFAEALRHLPLSETETVAILHILEQADELLWTFIKEELEHA